MGGPMIRLILWLSGWRVFTHRGVRICQRDMLIDQSAVSAAIEATEGKYSWCKPSRVTIYIERGPFVGYYGASATGEVCRYARFGRRATVRISSTRLYFEALSSLLKELGRDD